MFGSETFSVQGRESKHRGSESSMICTIEFYSVASMIEWCGYEAGD